MGLLITLVSWLFGGTTPVKRGQILWLVLVIAILIVAVLLFPRLYALYSLFWGADSFRRLFYEDFGLSEAMSQLLSVVLSIGYTISVFALVGWGIWKVIAWRGRPAQALRVIAAYLFVFALSPALHVLADGWVSPGQCFNQRTGEPIKWYVVEANGQVTLFDSPGFDKLGREKQPVTQEICTIFERQESGTAAAPLELDSLDEIVFFDPSTGGPLVWYIRDANGALRLFDRDGFDPQSGQRLTAVTAEIVAELKATQSQSKIEAAKAASAAAVDAAESRERAAAESSQAADAARTQHLKVVFATDAMPEGTVLIGPAKVGESNAASQLANRIIAMLRVRGTMANGWPALLDEELARLAGGDNSDLLDSGVGAKLMAGALVSTAVSCGSAQSVLDVRSCRVDATVAFVLDHGATIVRKAYAATGAGATEGAAIEQSLALLIERNSEILDMILDSRG